MNSKRVVAMGDFFDLLAVPAAVSPERRRRTRRQLATDRRLSTPHCSSSAAAPPPPPSVSSSRPSPAAANSSSTAMTPDNNGAAVGVDTSLYELIMNRQSDRLDDQRSDLGAPPRPRSCSALPTVELPDEVAEIVLRQAAGRLESQRATLKQSTDVVVEPLEPRCQSTVGHN